MGFVSDGANVYLGKGKIFVAEVVAGVRGGERYVGSSDVLTVTPAVEKKEKKDFALPNAPTLDSAVTGISADISMTLAEWMRDNLALALLGESATDTQASGTAAAEAMDDVSPGCSYKLGHRAVSVVVGHKGATTLVLGTDYDIADATVGLIYIREGGAVVDGDDLTWDYDFDADTTYKVPIAQAPSREFYLRFVGNPTRGRVQELEIWRCTMEPDGGLDLIAEDYGVIKIKGTVLSDSTYHSTEPFGILRQRAA